MNFETSRRDFLRTLGKGAVGAAALTAIPAVVSAEDKAPEAPAWPWAWQPLDKEEVKAKVFENFGKNGGCGAAVSSGIIDLLAEKYGYPYNQIPPKMFAHAAGGYGRQNLCGALGGAFAVLGLVTDNPGPIRGELYSWYEQTAFPIYVPAGDPEHAVHTVAGSELCKDSVGNFMAATGLTMGDPARVYRCKCLSADVAAKTVELLNIHFGFEAAPVVEEEAPATAANEYIGVGKGFGGDIKVKVTMNGDKIAKIEVLEHGETAGIFDKAYPSVTDAMVAANSADVDVVGGATFSSNGLIEAVKDALSQVKK